MKMIETKEMKLEDLFPAAYNNRKAWSKDQMTELVASVKQRGVLVPLIVREQADRHDKFEIVCGFRRYTAAKEAGVKMVPCSIRQMTDEEAYELMIIENLQREDIHPLDEGQAFVLLSETNTADQIATKIHKHKSYVIKRIKLASSLVEEGKKLFYEQAMNYGQALIISRLPETDQKKVLKDCLDTDDKGKKFMKHERDLMDYIRRHYMLTMDKAPFDLEDAELVKNAGPCSLCPKRTKNSPNLFDDMSKDDRCTDPQCFNLKEKRHFEQKAEQLKQKEGKVLTAIMDYHDKLVIGEKHVTPVSKKDYPDAIPVLVTGAKSSWDSDKVKGKVLYVRPDLKDPAPPKPSKAEAAKNEKEREKKRSEQSVKDKCLAFSIYLFRLLYHKATKGPELKPSKKFLADMWKSMTEIYRTGGDNVIHAIAVIDGFEIKGVPVQFPKRGETFEDAYCLAIGKKKNNYMAQPKADALDKEFEKKAYLRLADLPAINAMILFYLAQWTDHQMSIDAKSEYASALAEFKIDVKAERVRFSKDYDAEQKAAEKQKAAPKAEEKKPDSAKPAPKKAAVKKPAKKAARPAKKKA